MSQALTGGAQVLNAGSSLASSPAQTATDKKIPTMENLAALPFTKEFVSTQQTYAAATLITLPHSLGASPKLVSVDAVCVIAENGYAIGDVVALAAAIDATGVANVYGLTVRKDSTNIYVRPGAAGVALAAQPAGTGFITTPANWRLVVRAWA